MAHNRRNFIKGIGAAMMLPSLPAIAKNAPAGNHRVLCANIRVALDEDEKAGVGWSVRKDICLKILKSKTPDIICFQEVLKVQADDLRKFFTNYQLFGFEGPEMDPHPTGYFGIAKNPILFSRDRYEMITGGTYWLSETPLVALSKSWDTARSRHANLIRLIEKKTGKEFRIINLHLDHISAEAKINQAKMVIDESGQYLPEFNQILTGDFNSKFNSDVFQSVRNGGWKESYETLHGEVEAGHTGHEFQGEKYTKSGEKSRIDYIWYRGNIKPADFTVIKDSINGKYPSDHFFVQADLSIG